MTGDVIKLKVVLAAALRTLSSKTINRFGFSSSVPSSHVLFHVLVVRTSLNRRHEIMDTMLCVYVLRRRFERPATRSSDECSTGLSYRRLVRGGGFEPPCTSTLSTVHKAGGLPADCAPPGGSRTARPVRRFPPLLSYLAPTWG